MLNGGAGDDVIFFDVADNDMINGGLGTDTVKITDTGMIDFTNTAISNVEMIDIADNQAQTLNLSVTDVLEMTDNHNALFIDGDSKDSVQLTGFEKVADPHSMNNMYKDGYVMYADTASGVHTFVYVSDDIVM